MKKTLEIATDFMLVCVLLFAFILPIIVSFNLIPKLYTVPNQSGQTANVTNTNVLGVNTIDNVNPLEFVPQLTDSKFEKLVSTKKVGDAIVLDVEINPEGIVSRNSYVFFGNILNYSDRSTYKISILKNPDVSVNLKLSLKMNSTSFEEGDVLVTLAKGQKTELGLIHSSPVDINFVQKIKIIIEKAN